MSHLHDISPGSKQVTPRHQQRNRIGFQTCSALCNGKTSDLFKQSEQSQAVSSTLSPGFVFSLPSRNESHKGHHLISTQAVAKRQKTVSFQQLQNLKEFTWNHTSNLHQRIEGALKWVQQANSQSSLNFASLAASLPFKHKSSPTSAHERDLDQLFADIDTEGNGYIDAKHLQRALSKVGLPCGRDYMESLMKQYDENHDGRVDFKEFAHYVEKRRSDMEKAFDKLDLDGDQHVGAIRTQNLVKVLKKAGLPAKEADAQQMIKLLDTDKDGAISFQEFCKFCCLLPAAQLSHHNVIYDWMDSSDWLSHTEYRLSMVPPKASYERLLAGGIAGAISRTVVAPFERLRTIMMTESAMGFTEAWNSILSSHGPAGFWRGNTLTVAKTIPQQAIQFAAYDGFKDVLLGLFPRSRKTGLSQAEKLLAGCASGAVTILSTYPLEILRTRMALKGGNSNVKTICQQIWADQGFKGFYSGIRAGLLCEVLSVGLGFWAYELFQGIYRDKHNGESPSPKERGFLGGCSALVVLSTCMPIETTLRRLQAQGHPGRPVLYKNTRECFMAIYRKEGLRAFYRGILSSYMKVVPSIGLTYALYALIVQDWGIGGIRSFSHLNQDDEATLATNSADK